MRFRVKRGICALVASGIMIMSLCGFTRLDGFGYLYIQVDREVHDSTVYSVQYGSNPSIGNERAYFVESRLTDNALIPIVMNGSVRSTNTLSSIVNYAEEEMGLRVVCAINGDIFDMSSGCPKNPVIHDHTLISSGYEPDRVLAFDDSGRASLKNAKLSFKLSGRIGFSYYPVVEPSEEAVDEPAADEPSEEEGSEAGSEEEATPEPIYVERDWEDNAGFFNVPQGNYNGITIFNSHYASSTYTSGSRVETVVEFDEPPQLRIGETIEGRVSRVLVDVKNTPIAANEIILSANTGTEAGNSLASLIPDSTVEISVEAGESGLEEAKEAVGIYYSLVEDGKMVTSGSAINPRTALGIKKDGSVVLYALDGRQASISQGLSLPDLARHMMALGCTDAFNLDGGGSTTFYARVAGVDQKAVRKNSPSGGSERKVANALLLAYKAGSSSGEPKHLNIIANKYFAMPGAEIALSAYTSDENYEKTAASSSVRYSIKEGGGIIAGETYIADRAGDVVLTGKTGDLSSDISLKVVDDFSLSLSKSRLSLKAGETADVDAIGKVGPLQISVKDELFTWSVSGDVGSVDESGVFTAAEKAIGGLSGSLVCEYGELKAEIPVTVGAKLIEFDDTAEHWAKEPIGELAALGIINGMGVEGQNIFMPDEGLTRAQFLTMLAKTQRIDTSEWLYDGFSDVQPEDWFMPYVAWGYQNGIVSGVNESSFAPNAPITREQMAVMIGRFVEGLGGSFVKKLEWTGFSDGASIDDWALIHVGNMVTAGIMKGMPDGSFEPLAGATRAQAAKVVYELELNGLTKGEFSKPKAEYEEELYSEYEESSAEDENGVEE